MKGFLKRDFYLTLPNLRFYAVFVLVMGFLAFKAQGNAGFVHLYLMIFSASTILGLFNYDELNHWSAYGAATPLGRRRQVQARYVLTLLIGCACGAVMVLLCLTDGDLRDLPQAILFTGVFFLYVALILPLSYRFGTKSRLVLIVVIAVAGGVVAASSTTAIIATHANPVALGKLPLFLLGVGLAALGASYPISLVIMERKAL